MRQMRPGLRHRAAYVALDVDVSRPDDPRARPAAIR